MSEPKPPIDPEQMRRHAGDAARLLKGLANERRLMILCMLAEGECSVGEINERIDLSQSALSQHLAVLREENLVCTRRESQTIRYRLADGPAAAIIKLLHDLYCSKAPQDTDTPSAARGQSRPRAGVRPISPAHRSPDRS